MKRSKKNIFEQPFTTYYVCVIVCVCTMYVHVHRKHIYYFKYTQ